MEVHIKYIKVDAPNLSITRLWTPISHKGMWLGVVHKDICLRDWTMWLKYAKYSRVKNPHNWGAIWPLNEQENLNFDNEDIIHMSFKNYEACGYKHNSHLLIMSH